MCKATFPSTSTHGCLLRFVSAIPNFFAGNVSQFFTPPPSTLPPLGTVTAELAHLVRLTNAADSPMARAEANALTWLATSNQFVLLLPLGSCCVRGVFCAPPFYLCRPYFHNNRFSLPCSLRYPTSCPSSGTELNINCPTSNAPPSP